MNQKKQNSMNNKVCIIHSNDVHINDIIYYIKSNELNIEIIPFMFSIDGRYSRTDDNELRDLLEVIGVTEICKSFIIFGGTTQDQREISTRITESIPTIGSKAILVVDKGDINRTVTDPIFKKYYLFNDGDFSPLKLNMKHDDLISYIVEPYSSVGVIKRKQTSIPHSTTLFTKRRR